MPTSAPTERLGDVVTELVLVAANGDVGAVGELVMLICPALALVVKLNDVDEGKEEVAVAGLCPTPVVLNVCVLSHSSQAENPKFPMANICVKGQRVIRHDPAAVPICARPEGPHTHAVSVRSPQALMIADETHTPIYDESHVVWALIRRGETRRPRRNTAR
jgi:hypothetical protein